MIIRDLMKMAKTNDEREKVLDVVEQMMVVVAFLDRSIDLQDKTRSAFKSKLIGESRAYTEKAREILQGLINIPPTLSP